MTSEVTAPGSERTAIVTGGSRGIGRNTAVNFARRGVDILITYHSNRAEADSLVSEVEAMGRRAAAFPLDTGDIRLFDPFVAGGTQHSAELGAGPV